MKSDSVDKNVVKKFNELVTNRHWRGSYIVRPKWLYNDGEAGKPKYLTVCQYLSDRIVAKHINNELTIGGKIARIGEGNEFTSVINLDIDRPEKQLVYVYDTIYKLILKINQPSFVFEHETSGRQHHLIYLDKTISFKQLEFLRTIVKTDLNREHIQAVEIKPDRAGVRFMFGGSYQLLDTHSLTAIAPYDHQTEIETAYACVQANQITVGSVDVIRRSLDNIAQQQRLLELDYEPKEVQSRFYVSGNLWDNVKKLETVGLTAPSTRHREQFDIVRACVHRGLTEQQTVGYVLQDWLPNKHNDQSRDFKRAVQTGNYETIASEVRRQYRLTAKTFNRKRYKRNPITLTDEETTAICKYAEDLTANDSLKPKQRDKVATLLCCLYQLHKNAGSNDIVAVPHTLFDKWGFSQRKQYKTKTGKALPLFDAVAYILNKEAIRPLYSRSYTKVCQRYELNFIKNYTQYINSLPSTAQPRLRKPLIKWLGCGNVVSENDSRNSIDVKKSRQAGMVMYMSSCEPERTGITGRTKPP